MIERVILQNFKSHRSSTVQLRPLSLLVGPNGTGKTSVLDALCILGESHFRSLANQLVLNRHPRHLVRHAPGVNGFALEAEGLSQFTCRRIRIQVDITQQSGVDAAGVERTTWSPHGGYTLLDSSADLAKAYTNSLGDAGMGAYWPELRSAVKFRLNASQVGLPTQAAYEYRINPDGSGLAGFMASLKLTDEARFDRILSDLQHILPRVRSVRTPPAEVVVPKVGTLPGYQLIFDFDGAPNVDASGVSEGTLLALAILAIIHGPQRPQVLLLDDLHEALHPTAQMRLMDVLKPLTVGPNAVQIIATTHSPFILDKVEPEAIQVFALRQDGSIAVRSLSEHPDVAQYRGALSSGQLWTLDNEQDWVIEAAS